MSINQGMANLVSKALLYESKGKRVSQKFMKYDSDAVGYINEMDAAAIICDILRIPNPSNLDQQSSDSRKKILTQCGFKLVPHPKNPKEKVIEYGKFLKAFHRALRTTPLIASNPYVKSDIERSLNANKLNVLKSNMSKEEIVKAIDLNLPKYYRSTTEAFLRMKPPGGKMRIKDFGRFMRSINLDLTDDMLLQVFKEFDKNNNGALDAWEFFDGFGGSISGHKDTSTSLFMGNPLPFKEPKHIEEANLTAEQTCELIKARLPFHYRSSTKAFLAAKGGDPNSKGIAFKDLKLFLQNLNIVVPDSAINGLFKYLDDDGSGKVTAKEFIAAFGHAISGEKADNIQDSDHLSYHNTRPDNRVPIVPSRHKWTYDEVKKTLGDRLGMIHTSSTMAFMKAKKSNSRFLTVEDLKRILFNLNIDPPMSIIQRIYDDMDGNGNNQITCAEFLESFGSHINGFAGSFETKPDWFYTELANLSAHIDRIEGTYAVAPAAAPTYDDYPEEKSKKPTALTHAQEVKFMRKFGISPEEMKYLNDTNAVNDPGTMEFAPSPITRPRSASNERPRSAGPARPQSAGQDQRRSSSVERPRSAGSARPGSAGSNNAGFRGRPHTTGSSERPRSASRERPRSAGPTRPRSARDIQNAVNFSNTHSESYDRDDPFEPIITSLGGTKRPDIFVNTGEAVGPESPTGDISDFSDKALLNELRSRKSMKDRANLSKSMPKRKQKIDPSWEVPTSRFSGFSQGPHYQSTVANKLKTAQKIADLLEKKKARKQKQKGQSKYHKNRESSPICHEQKFRF